MTLDVLDMGTTEDNFHLFMSLPHEMKQFSNFVSDGAIVLPVDLIMCARIPSDQLA